MAETIGALSIYGPTDKHDEGGGWSIAAARFGWLPGSYATRDAALIAYGIVLFDPLWDDKLGRLRDIAAMKSRLITVADIESLR